MFLLKFLSICAILNLLTAQAAKKSLSIVYLGDSITEGGYLPKPDQDAPPAQACRWLEAQSDIGEVRCSNKGYSGATTDDYLPDKDFFAEVTEAGYIYDRESPNSTLIFSIALGTNDSAVRGTHGTPMSPKQFTKNLKTIIDRLLSLYSHARVIVHLPLWYTPNTHNSAVFLRRGSEKLARLRTEIQSLVEKYETSGVTRVHLGDTKGRAHFKKNYKELFRPEKGPAGTYYVHPNQRGAADLGKLWGEAIYGLRHSLEGDEAP